MPDTIFALSSGAPPAAIAVVRISGPGAGIALESLAGRLPPARRAVFVTLRDRDHHILDRALVLWLPGPNTSTGEDCSELHLHGGRAVVAAVESALAALPGCRRAFPGEFTRRAFLNGRIDLAEAEGLADLLSAETELQRQSALQMAGGSVSRTFSDWRERVLLLSAELEASLDFSDDDGVGDLPPSFTWNIVVLRREINEWLVAPRAEPLREGIRVVLAGPPNAGKSTLFNALLETDAAITSPTAGTTRDVLTRAVSIEGVPFMLFDTAGLRDDAPDAIEAIGVERARNELHRADIVLWLGAEGEGPGNAWDIAAKSDCRGVVPKSTARRSVSAVTGDGLHALRHDLVEHARALLPRPHQAALNERQHRWLAEAEEALAAAAMADDALLVGENLRIARQAFDALLGRAATEDMLDALFGRFCIGK